MKLLYRPALGVSVISVGRLVSRLFGRAIGRLAMSFGIHSEGR